MTKIRQQKRVQRRSVVSGLAGLLGSGVVGLFGSGMVVLFGSGAVLLFGSGLVVIGSDTCLAARVSGDETISGHEAMFEGASSANVPVSRFKSVDGPDSESFLATLGNSPAVTDVLKAEIAKRFEEMVAQGVPAKDAATECLMMAYPEYRQAVTALDADDLAGGLKSMQSLSDHTNPYLAADASFFLGRALLLAGQHENAITPLSRLSGDLKDNTMRESESLYYLGTAQAGLLQIEAAMDNLVRFLQEDTSAPERLKMGAYNQLVKLEKVKKDTLEDAHLRMGYSERRLGQALPGQETQQQQEKVVSILNKLITESEKKECSSCQKGGKCNKPGDPSQKPGEKPQQQPKPGNCTTPGQSSNANGSAEQQSFDNGPISIWSQLRDRDRDPANSAVKENLPPEYRKLIERYYREMSEGTQR